MKRMHSVFIKLLFHVVILTSVENTLVSVNTTYGEIVGQLVEVSVRTENSLEKYLVQSFEGIPFAQPPTGNLRFKAPIEPEPWVIKRLALKPSKLCVQQLPINISLPIPESEDCLYLNVWTPVPVPKKATVMVWIYGGAFSMGTTILYNYKKIAATQGVVVVSMNYRVSSLGFLYFGNEECPGNMGLLDQNLALKWVRDNIDRFGGDPEKVTIFGQSSGSASAAFHFLNPNSGHLFKRVILESGPIGTWSLDTKKLALERSFKVSRAVGCGEDPSNVERIVDCLRKVDAKIFIEFATQAVEDNLNYRPVEDDVFIRRNLYDVLKYRKNKQVLLGTVSDDGAFLIEQLLLVRKVRPEDIFDAFIEKYLGNLSNEVRQCVRYSHESQYTASSKYAEEILTTRCSTTFSFSCDTNEMADHFAEAEIPTYMYQWTHRPKLSISLPWVRADHTSEIPFLLGLQYPLLFLPGLELSENELSRRLMTYWGNFAKYGDPNGETGTIHTGEEKLKLDPWPIYTLAKKERLEIGLNRSVSKLGPLDGKQCYFWKHIFPNISNASPKTVSSVCKTLN